MDTQFEKVCWESTEPVGVVELMRGCIWCGESMGYSEWETHPPQGESE